MSFDYIQKHYGVPAERGRQVTCYGERGVIVGTHAAYITVVIDGDKSERERNYHPTDDVVYGDIVDAPVLREWKCLMPRDRWDDWDSPAVFTVTASTRSKARYKAFIDLTDCYALEGKDLIRIRVKGVPLLKKSTPADDEIDNDLPF
jgi:hypothetical protein